MTEATYMSVKELAKHFNISQATISKMLRSTDIPHLRLGKTIRFNRADVLTWADRHFKRNALPAPAAVETQGAQAEMQLAA